MFSMMVVASLLLILAAPAGDWHPLGSESAQASSYLQNNWNQFTENYHPNYAFDGDPNTAWVEGVEGDGVGQWLEWPISRLESAQAFKVRIRAGYHKSKALLAANNAPNQVQLELRDPSGRVVAQQKWSLQPTLGWQETILEVPGARDVAALRLTILGVRPGSKYRDTCISDLETLVRSTVPYKADVEAKKKKALLSWAKERKSQATYFAKLPKTYPFAATHFEVESRTANQPGGDDEGTPVPGFAPLGEQLEDGNLAPALGEVVGPKFLEGVKGIEVAIKVRGASVGDQLRRPATKRKIPTPDGLEDLPYTLRSFPFLVGFLDPTNVSYFEAKPEARIDLRAEGAAAELTQSFYLSHFRVRYSDPAGQRPATAYFQEQHVVEERSVYETRTDYLVDFDAAGRPSRIRTKEEGTDDLLGYTVLELAYDGEGRVQGLELRRLVFSKDLEELPGTNYALHQKYRARTEVAAK